ncbi:MAG TPA: hypothetical protein VFY10_15180 [Dehalococcoidia bacterium]|jgi:hypothetical protein|nr:hypothetical protein [Dehalococcoidia bacterium]
MGVNGNWNVVLELPGGNQEASMEITAEGGNVRGQLLTATGPQAFDGRVDEDSVTWTVNQITATGPIPLVFEGIVSGDQIAGNVEVGDFGLGGTFVARRCA